MSDNPITVLYVKDEDGNLKRIEPKTIADAVNDETNVDTVQAFINDGIDDWSNVSEDKKYQYATAIFLKNQFDDFGLKFKNTMKYDIPDWDVTDQTDYSGIKLPVKRGYTYKVVGEEAEINERVFKPGDFAIINRDIDVGDEIRDEDIDLLIGYGNEGTKIYRYVADVVKTKADLLEYPGDDPERIKLLGPKENSIIIVLNDESHNLLLSFYEYIEGYDYDYEVDTYEDLIHIQTRLDVPNYDYSIDENVRIITLLKYTGELLNVPVPYVLYPKQYDIVRVKTDETHDNKTTYYQWNEELEIWEYKEISGFNWVYMFSKENENSVYRVKGTVETFEDLPRIDNQVGDVWNVADTGANYVWTEPNGTGSGVWDKLSETYDLSKYETVESSTIKINNERIRATQAEDDLSQRINALLFDLANEIERATNAESQLREIINESSSDLANEIERATNAESQLNATKLDKVTNPDIIYGTDSNGNQTTYNYNDLGKVDDVKVGDTSVVSNKIAVLGTMAGENVDDYSTKDEADLLYAEKELELTVSEHISNMDNPHNVTKEQIGLGNVDNTSDMDKPISPAQQSALDEKLDKVSSADKVYGTDSNGNQTTYEIDSFGKVDDVKVNGTSVVSEKIANITLGTMAEEDASNYYTKEEADEKFELPPISEETNGLLLSNDGEKPQWVSRPGVLVRNWKL